VLELGLRGIVLCHDAVSIFAYRRFFVGQVHHVHQSVRVHQDNVLQEDRDACSAIKSYWPP
jgi:hypothetical protein